MFRAWEYDTTLDGTTLQRLMFYSIDNECISHIQMRILIEYIMHMHMPTEHTQYNDKYTMLPK